MSGCLITGIAILKSLTPDSGLKTQFILFRELVPGAQVPVLAGL